MQAQLDRQAQLHGLGSTAPACWLARQARLAWQSQADPAGPAGLAACWARLAKPWLARQGPAAQPGPAAQLDPAAQAQLAWPGRPHSLARPHRRSWPSPADPPQAYWPGWPGWQARQARLARLARQAQLARLTRLAQLARHKPS